MYLEHLVNHWAPWHMNHHPILPVLTIGSEGSSLHLVVSRSLCLDPARSPVHERDLCLLFLDPARSPLHKQDPYLLCLVSPRSPIQEDSHIRCWIPLRKKLDVNLLESNRASAQGTLWQDLLSQLQSSVSGYVMLTQKNTLKWSRFSWLYQKKWWTWWLHCIFWFLTIATRWQMSTFPRTRCLIDSSNLSPTNASSQFPLFSQPRKVITDSSATLPFLSSLPAAQQQL